MSRIEAIQEIVNEYMRDYPIAMSVNMDYNIEKWKQYEAENAYMLEFAAEEMLKEIKKKVGDI